MVDYERKAPRKRSALRVYAGWLLYNMMRSLQWFLRRREYVRLRDSKRDREGTERFVCTSAEHKTPLRRNLKDEEMWMQENKVHNLSLALKRLDGIVLEPGKSFSYWKLIGPPLGFRGFNKGMVLVNGTVRARSGGGLCQLSNLLYWMTLHTPLTVTERFRHSYDVFPDSRRTQPFGSGATCVYKYRDLQFRNDSVEPFRLSLKLEEGFLKGEWQTEAATGWTYEVYEKKHWISQGWAGSYIRNNILHRRCFREGELSHDEYLTENHALMMYSPLLNEPDVFAEES
ncbi:MAG: VanW family protein [Spirochaetales bacterium]|nr:VanW family protein [Spirochaetales bacterium]